MPILLGMASIATMLAIIVATNFSAQKTEIREQQAISQGESVLIYRNLVHNYAQANPAFTGVVTDSMLTMPSWYTRFPDFQAYAQNGRAYVYFTGEQGHSMGRPALESMVGNKTNMTLLIGIARGGFLQSPHGGDTQVALPAAIPEGATVLVL
jgi:hypothetical protein